MDYIPFGRSGLRVSQLCLGTMSFGNEESWGADRAASRAIFEAFVEAGGNFIDTAHIYGGGRSEAYLGEFIQADRDSLVLATKYSPGASGGIAKWGTSRKAMRHCVEESLRRLNTDHIDVYWVHIWDYVTPIEEVVRGLEDLVASGKVLYVAASDMPAWEISRGHTLQTIRGGAPFTGIQVKYNLLDRTAERDLLPMARELEMGVVAWSPLARGALTAKALDPNAEAPRRPGFDTSDRTMRIVRVVADIAAEIGCTASQVAIAALRQQDRFGDVIPILGVRTIEQLRDNMGCLDVTLSAEQLARIDEVSAVDLGFPHEDLQSPWMRGLVTAGQADRLKPRRR